MLVLAGACQADQHGLQWQLALERQGFSPGLIDGKPGQKTAIATAEFQRSHQLPATGRLDSATIDALGLPTPTTTYTITDQDVTFVTGPAPRSWVAKSKLDYLGYATLGEELAEKFHTSRDCLARLNPRLRLDRVRPGEQLVVPNIQPPVPGHVERLEVDLGHKIIRGYGGDGRLVAMFYCSIAAHAEKRPSGEAHIVAVAVNPTYRFDPKMWPEVKNVSQKLLIAPGPRNPVGLCWIGLSLPGYGMHGTPNPELIGKTGSHGCFRLTNWDAVRLGKMVHAGVKVRFI